MLCFHLQEMVYYGTVGDGDDVQDILVSEGGVVGRWNPDIMSGKTQEVRICVRVQLQMFHVSRGRWSGAETLTSCLAKHKRWVCVWVYVHACVRVFL